MLVAIAACDGPTEQEGDAALDAGPGVDAAVLPGCEPVTARVTAAVEPAPGAYCATWTHLDGVIDPFARYFDRADVTLDGVRWWTSGSLGAEAYTAGASLVDGCLAVEPFATPDGWSGSGRLLLCWSSPTVAEGVLGWCSPGLRDGHWSVRLDRC